MVGVILLAYQCHFVSSASIDSFYICIVAQNNPFQQLQVHRISTYITNGQH